MRFKFPADWLEYEVIDGEWGAFQDILKRRTSAMEEEIPVLQTKIVAEGVSTIFVDVT